MKAHTLCKARRNIDFSVIIPHSLHTIMFQKKPLHLSRICILISDLTIKHPSHSMCGFWSHGQTFYGKSAQFKLEFISTNVLLVKVVVSGVLIIPYHSATLCSVMLQLTHQQGFNKTRLSVLTRNQPKPLDTENVHCHSRIRDVVDNVPLLFQQLYRHCCQKCVNLLMKYWMDLFQNTKSGVRLKKSELCKASTRCLLSWFRQAAISIHHRPCAQASSTPQSWFVHLLIISPFSCVFFHCLQ